MFFKRKQVDDFSEAVGVVRSYLDRDDYDSALARYHKVKYVFDKLPNEKKELYYSEFNSISNQLIVYMHIEELKTIMEYGDLEIIKEKLDHIKLITNTTENFSSSFLNYVKEKYGFYMNKYKLKIVYKEIQAKLDEINTLKDEENYDFALQKLPGLIKSYRKLTDFAIETKDILEDIDSLREELKLKLLESRAYSPVAKVNLRRKRKKTKKRK